MWPSGLHTQARGKHHADAHQRGPGWSPALRSAGCPRPGSPHLRAARPGPRLPASALAARHRPRQEPPLLCPDARPGHQGHGRGPAARRESGLSPAAGPPWDQDRPVRTPPRQSEKAAGLPSGGRASNTRQTAGAARELRRGAQRAPAPARLLLPPPCEGLRLCCRTSGGSGRVFQTGVRRPVRS